MGYTTHSGAARLETAQRTKRCTRSNLRTQMAGGSHMWLLPESSPASGHCSKTGSGNAWKSRPHSRVWSKWDLGLHCICLGQGAPSVQHVPPAWPYALWWPGMGPWGIRHPVSALQVLAQVAQHPGLSLLPTGRFPGVMAGGVGMGGRCAGRSYDHSIMGDAHCC